MGNRRNIRMINPNRQDSDIYFYTHWGADELPYILGRALERGKDRWDDWPYLNRIIFSEMIKDDIESNTGFGIATYEPDKNKQTIEVNIVKRKVFLHRWYSFKDYIERFSKHV